MPKTLFGKVIHSMNTSQYHNGQRFSNVSSGHSPLNTGNNVYTQALNTQYGDSNEATNPQRQMQKGSHQQYSVNADYDMKDSCREMASCQNSHIFCGYQTGRSCGMSNDSQVVMEH